MLLELARATSFANLKIKAWSCRKKFSKLKIWKWQPLSQPSSCPSPQIAPFLCSGRISNPAFTSANVYTVLQGRWGEWQQSTAVQSLFLIWTPSTSTVVPHKCKGFESLVYQMATSLSQNFWLLPPATNLWFRLELPSFPGLARCYSQPTLVSKVVHLAKAMAILAPFPKKDTNVARHSNRDWFSFTSSAISSRFPEPLSPARRRKTAWLSGNHQGHWPSRSCFLPQNLRHHFIPFEASNRLISPC